MLHHTDRTAVSAGKQIFQGLFFPEWIEVEDMEEGVDEVVDTNMLEVLMIEMVSLRSRSCNTSLMTSGQTQILPPRVPALQDQQPRHRVHDPHRSGGPRHNSHHPSHRFFFLLLLLNHSLNSPNPLQCGKWARRSRRISLKISRRGDSTYLISVTIPDSG